MKCPLRENMCGEMAACNPECACRVADLPDGGIRYAYCAFAVIAVELANKKGVNLCKRYEEER